MTIQEIESNLVTWREYLTNKQKRYIHFNSLANFVFHFENLPTEKLKEIVLIYLTEYVQEIQQHNASFTSRESYELVTRHLNRLSDVYSSRLGFKSILTLKFVILFSIIGDGLLYLLLRNKFFIYFPIITISLFTYYLSRRLLLEKKRKLFGLFY